MALTKILLTTDGSEGAASATRMALKLSRTLGSKLHAVYVEPMPDPLAWPEAPRFSIRKT